MPSLQTVNLNPPARTEQTVLEKTLAGFAGRNRENEIDKRDTDALSDIYKTYKEQGQTLDDAIMAIQTRPGMSPTARVNSINQLTSLKKTNVQLQKQVEKESKAQQKIDKQEEKKRFEAEADEAEMEFLQELEGKNLKPTEIYKQARLKNIPRVRAKDIANLHRMEGKEGRLSEGNITSDYDFELRELASKIKDEASPKKKKPLQDEREKLVKQRKQDLARFRAGERDFTLAMHASENAEEAAEEKAEVQAEKSPEEIVIEALTQTFPPAQFAGKSKWDKNGNEFKSDGKKWALVRK